MNNKGRSSGSSSNSIIITTTNISDKRIKTHITKSNLSIKNYKKAEKFKLLDTKDSSFYLRTPLREKKERARNTTAFDGSNNPVQMLCANASGLALGFKTSGVRLTSDSLSLTV